MKGLKDKLSSIGKKGSISMDGLSIEVKVVDFKQSYGRDRWLVTPVSGKGQKWIEQNPVA